MDARKVAMIAVLFVLAVTGACAPAPTAVPTAVPPTAVPPAAPTVAPKPTSAPAVALDIKSVVDKYLAGLPDGFGAISPAALKDQMAATKLFVVDVREASEIASAGFVAGSVNIPVRTLMKNLDKLPAKDQPIVVMCGSGHRSAVGMAALQMLGYTNVKSLAGGFGAWKSANLPVATGSPTAPVAGNAPTVDQDLLAALDKYFTNLPDGFGTIQAVALKDQMAATKLFVVDVRETSEVASNGYIDGSVNIPIRTLTKSLDKLPAKDQPIVVTCGSGHRSAIGMEALQLLGYTNVKSLAGGFGAWKAAGLPITGVPAAAAFDMRATLDKYLTNLPDGFGTITPAAMKDQMAATKVFVIDIREASEIASAGYVEGAVNIPIRTFMKNLDKLPAKDQPIIVMCGSGHRSALGMEALQLLGYTNVKSLAGGFGAWKNANLPVATGKPADPTAGKAPEADKDLLAALDKYFGGLPDGFGTIQATALNDMLAASKPFQVDVRETKEVTDNGSIAGSISVPIRTLIKNLDKMPQDKAAVVIAECGSGHRSAMAMMALNLLGYTNVKSLAGGFAAWKNSNLPIAKTTN